MKKELSYLLQTFVPSIFKNTFLSLRYGCFIHPSAKIYWARNLKLSRGVRIGKGVVIMAQKNKKSVVLGKNVVIEDYSIINNHNGFIEIKDNTTINQYSMIQSTLDNTVRIGERVAIAPYTRIVPNHSYNGENRTGTIHASTEIGNNVWIGAGVTIVIGVNIGKNSIIGANSVVTRDIEDNVVAAGTPAKLIKTFQEYVQKQNS